jgi:hypothetical protein
MILQRTLSIIPLFLLPLLGEPLAADGLDACSRLGFVGDRYRIVRPAESEPEFAPDPGMSGASVVWRGDWDQDGRQDLFVRFSDDCGNWGECPYSLLQGCGDGLFAAVLDGEYAVSMAVLEGSGPGADSEIEMVVRCNEAETATIRLRLEDGRLRIPEGAGCR